MQFCTIQNVKGNEGYIKNCNANLIHKCKNTKLKWKSKLALSVGRFATFLLSASGTKQKTYPRIQRLQLLRIPRTASVTYIDLILWTTLKILQCKCLFSHVVEVTTTDSCSCDTVLIWPFAGVQTNTHPQRRQPTYITITITVCGCGCFRRIQVSLFLGFANVLLIPDTLVTKPVGNLQAYKQNICHFILPATLLH